MLLSRAQRVRLGALCLAVAGILLVVYPAIRPFSDETSLLAAAAFVTGAWVLAHVLAMLGFILVTLALLGLHLLLRQSPAEGLAAMALVLTLVGTGLVLPYYGVETFGLHVLGQEAMREQNPALVSLAHDIRYSMPQVLMFGGGLVLLAVGAVLAAAAVWRSGTLAKWSGAAFALGFVLYTPQFFGTQPVRIAHGVLVAVGCLWLATAMWQAAGSPRAWA